MTEAHAGRVLLWRQLQFTRPLDHELVTGLLRQWAADQRTPSVVLEARATEAGVRYLFAAPAGVSRQLAGGMRALVPGLSLSTAAERRPGPRGRAVPGLDPAPGAPPCRPLAVVRAILAALTQVRDDEELVLQLLLGPGRIPLAIPTQSPSSIVQPWYHSAWYGNQGRVDSEKRTALRDKVADHGFACNLRLGVIADSRGRRRALLMGLFAAIRTAEAPGIQLRAVNLGPARLDRAERGWRWALRMGVQELTGLTAWPLGDDDLPGQPPAHPRRLPPADGTTTQGPRRRPRTRGRSRRRLPAAERRRRQAPHPRPRADRHRQVGAAVAPDRRRHRRRAAASSSSTRKATSSRPCSARSPTNRRDDVVVLDANDTAPVGFNPLAATGRNPEVVADSLLSVFKVLYAEAWGPRTQDIIHACLLTMAGRPDASIVMLPLLLTNAGYRRRVTADIHDPIALGPFWAWYDRLSPQEQQQVIAAPMNKLRQWLLRPSLRAMLGQTDPKFEMRQVFTERKILLVSLASGVIGPEAANLLGSLVVAELWQATLERSAIPAAKRHPVMVYLDEFATFLNLPTNLADALARSRGMGVAYTLAHQFLTQLTPAMRAAVLSNTRSRVCFQLSADDAVTIARTTPDLVAEDFTALGAHEVYASLFAGGRTSPYASGVTLPPAEPISKPDELRRLSRERYGRPIAEVEAAWNADHPRRPGNRRRDRADHRGARGDQHERADILPDRASPDSMPPLRSPIRSPLRSCRPRPHPHQQIRTLDLIRLG